MLTALDKPSTHFRSNPARGVTSVDREGGDDGAGLIRGLVVLTGGEVSDQRGQFIDSHFLQQVADAINQNSMGAKARFTHPGLSGDGFGSFLGRAKAARVIGDVVRADLHMSTTAHATPDGDLAKYTLDLAEADPAAFGASISFKRDFKAEKLFAAQQRVGGSPEIGNPNNHPHVRLARLHAVDIVDDPATNPEGLFQRGQGIARDAEALLSYSLGLTTEAPELVELGIDAERGAGFVKRFLDRHDLAIVPKRQPTQENWTMNDELRKYLETVGLDSNATLEQAVTFCAALPADKRAQAEAYRTLLGDGQPAATVQPVAPVAPVAAPLTTLSAAPAPAPVDVEAVKEAATAEGRKLELARQTDIRELGRADVDPALVTQAIKEEWSKEDAATKFLEDLRKRRAPAAEVGRDLSEDLAAVLTDAICFGAGDKLDGDARRIGNCEQFRGMGMQALARLCMSRAGVTPKGHSDEAQFAAAISTGTYTTILGDTLQRTLHRGYGEFPSTFTRIAVDREVKDFRSVTDIKISDFASPPEVGAGGELAHAKLEESTESYKVLTYGNRFSLTRRDFINDDLSAFTRVPRKLGTAMARNIDDLGYAMLISNSGLGPTMNEDSQKLFYTGRTTPNYQTTNVLADAGLAALATLMIKIKHGDTQLALLPTKLLVPAALRHTALKLTRSQMLRDIGDGDVVGTPTHNPHLGQYEVIVEPRLDAGTNGATAYYILPDFSQAEALIIAYLRGNRNPTIERKDPTDVLGIGWWAYHDVGVAAIDWRGIARSKGA